MTESRFPYEGPPELLPVIVAALEQVVDPEVALNVVDVGLIYGVRVGAGRIDVAVTMTTPACPVAGVIVEDIEQELTDRLPQPMAVHVALVWEPPWTPERMSPRARAFMGW